MDNDFKEPNISGLSLDLKLYIFVKQLKSQCKNSLSLKPKQCEFFQSYFMHYC